MAAGGDGVQQAAVGVLLRPRVSAPGASLRPGGDGETAAEWETPARRGRTGGTERVAEGPPLAPSPTAAPGGHALRSRIRHRVGPDHSSATFRSASRDEEIYAQDDMKAAAEAMQRVG